jgi:hypothetical protein
MSKVTKSAEAILAQKKLYQKHLRTLQQSSLARDVLQSKTRRHHIMCVIYCRTWRWERSSFLYTSIFFFLILKYQVTAQLQHTAYTRGLVSWPMDAKSMYRPTLSDIGSLLCIRRSTGWMPGKENRGEGEKGQDFIRPWHMTMCFLPTCLTRQFLLSSYIYPFFS